MLNKLPSRYFVCGTVALYFVYNIAYMNNILLPIQTTLWGVVYTAKNDNLKTIGQNMNNEAGVWLTAVLSYDWQWGTTPSPVSLKSEPGVICKLHISFKVTTHFHPLEWK